MEANYVFSVIKREDLDQASELIGAVFSKHDIVTPHMKINQSDLSATVKKILASNIDEGLTFVAKDVNGKIIGCTNGRRFSKIWTTVDEHDKPLDKLSFEFDPDTATYEDKGKIIHQTIETLMRPLIQKHIHLDDMHVNVYGNYFCVSEEYFGSLLAKRLLAYSIKMLKEKGIKNLYSTIFSIKSEKICSKIFGGNYANNLTLSLIKDGETKEFYAKVLVGEIDKANLEG